MLRGFRLGKAVFVPTLTALRKEAAGCRACPLWEHATQTVFGAGEDLEGEPLVGPAGPSRAGASSPRAGPWLEAELAVVRPRVLVCLGAPAAIHPSAILRAGEKREAEMKAFVEDLRLVASVL